jgi:L-lactate dehydrogenase complex protein LldG
MSGTPPAPTDARAAILGRIRAALADAPDPVAIPRDYEQAAPVDLDVVERFVERAADYRATVRRVDPADLPAAIATILTAHDVRRLVVPDGVPEGWLGMTGSGVDAVRDDPPLGYPELNAVDGVLTGCAVAIAETGTIVLDAAPDQGRRVLSLLPDLHVCVVTVDQIAGSVPEALARLEPTRPLTWISGPSATSDIELRRVEGVHGPRRLEIVVVEGDGPA